MAKGKPPRERTGLSRQIISGYMAVIASEQKLLKMRPYQVYQVKHVGQCIHDNCDNGYIRSTADSSETLTFFKASTLPKDNPAVNPGFRDRRKQTLFIDALVGNLFATRPNTFSCD